MEWLEQKTDFSGLKEKVGLSMDVLLNDPNT
jgi:hypothetical protein